jgi:hypothetical protein
MVPVLVSNLFFEVSILLLDIFLAFGTGLIKGGGGPPPFKFQPSQTPQYPHPPKLELVPSVHLYTVFCSNDV